jgi:5-methylcytosine-specific restriction endonuclease McrA
LLIRALEAAREGLYQRAHRAEPEWGRDPALTPPTMAQQQADALALLAETALHHGIDPGAPGERYQVVVHVDAAVLSDPEQPGQSALEDGVRVPAGTSLRLACHASRVIMRHDEHGRIVEVGGRARAVPPALWRALRHRDCGCRFPGCGLRYTEAHHVRHWAHGGPTKLSNLALLCRRHHRAVHEDGYSIVQHPDGALEFRRPDGRSLPDVPAPAPVPADPYQALRAANDERGVQIHPNTSRPLWSGERLDVGWAIDVLHPFASGEIPLTTGEIDNVTGETGNAAGETESDADDDTLT